MKNHLAKKDDALTDSSFFTLHVLISEKERGTDLPRIVIAVPSIGNGLCGIFPCHLTRLAYSYIVISRQLQWTEEKTSTHIHAEGGVFQTPYRLFVIGQVLFLVSHGKAQLRTGKPKHTRIRTQIHRIPQRQGYNDLLCFQGVHLSRITTADRTIIYVYL